MALSRSLAGECVVLLENDGALPLSGTGKLALYGDGARHTVRGGTASGDVNIRSDVNMPQILKLLAQAPRIAYIAATDGRYGEAMAVGDGIGAKQMLLDILT